MGTPVVRGWVLKESNILAKDSIGGIILWDAVLGVIQSFNLIGNPVAVYPILLASAMNTLYR